MSVRQAQGQESKPKPWQKWEVEALDILQKGYHDTEAEKVMLVRKSPKDSLMSAYDSIDALLDSLQNPHTYILKKQKSESLRYSFFNTKPLSPGFSFVRTLDFLIFVSDVNSRSLFERRLSIGDRILSVNGYSEYANIYHALKVPTQPVSYVVRRAVTADIDALFGTVLPELDPIDKYSKLSTIQGTSGYLHLQTFSSTADKSVMIKLRSFEREHVDNLIFDLRGNRGGRLGAVLNIASMLIDKTGTLLEYKCYNETGEFVPWKHEGADEAIHDVYNCTIKQLVFLVDQMTASASEILLGSIQEHLPRDRYAIIGVPTSGKGSVSLERQLSENRSIVYTTAEYVFPSTGRRIQFPLSGTIKEQESLSRSIEHRMSSGFDHNGILPDSLV